MIELLAALTLYMTAPTIRENEAALYSNEIDYYELFRNGELYLTVSPDDEAGNASVDVLEDGDYQARVYDIEGLVSELSPAVSVNNAVRARPNPPGLGRKRVTE